MTTATKPQFRRTKQGEWVAFGPTSQIRLGTIQVAKRDGNTKTVQVERIGRVFKVDGVDCAYGYLGQSRQSRQSSGQSIPRRDRCRHCGGNGSVEAELGTCAACGADFDT